MLKKSPKDVLLSTVHRLPSTVYRISSTVGYVKKMPETGFDRPVSGITEVNDVFVRFFISGGKGWIFF